MSVSANPAKFGQLISLHATVTPQPSGKVTFYDGVKVLGVAAVQSGSATFATASIATGSHNVSARYDGDGTYAQSVSAIVPLTVNSAVASGLLPLPVFGPSYILGALSVDLNNDHFQDLVVIEGTYQVDLFFGTGTGAFTAGPTYAIAATQAAAGDFNGDGNVDLVFNTPQSNNIQILLGTGNGAFSAPTPLAITDNPYIYAVQTGDLNADGKVDLLVLASSGLLTFLGNGEGTFRQPILSTYPGFSGDNLLIADFNRDGKSDVIAASRLGDYFLAGVGDGSFVGGISTGLFSYTVVTADFNGDGKLDLLSNYSPGAYVALGNGDGTFGSPAQMDASYYAIGDFNGDGKIDLLSGSGPAFGNGDGTFQPLLNLNPSSSQSYDLLAATDTNNNGQLDLIDLQYYYGASTVGGIAVFLGTTFPTVSLTASPNPAAYNAPLSLTATVTPATATGSVIFSDGSSQIGTVTITGGQASLTVTPQSAGKHVLSARYSGDAETQPASSAPVTTTVNGTASATTLTSSTVSATYGQVLTLTATVVPSATAGSVTFYDGASVLGAAPVHSGVATFSTINFNTGAHSLSAQYGGGGSISSSVSAALNVTVNALPGGFLNGGSDLVPGSGYTLALAAADLNKDGRSDLIAVNQDFTLSVFLATGSGAFAAPVNYPTGAEVSQVTPLDVNGDGIPDLVLQTTAGLSILTGNGNGTFAPASALAAPGSNYAFSDFNRDGRVDVIYSPANGGPITVLLGNGDGTFQGPLATSIGDQSKVLAAVDLNGDGNADLVIDQAQILLISLGRGDSTFAPPVTVSGIAGASLAAVGDLNHDGYLDLVVGQGNVFTSLLGRGDGSFTVGAGFSNQNYLASFVLTDLDGDGNLDLFISTSYGASGYYPGKGDGNFGAYAATYIYSGGGQVVFGDFSGTGRVSPATGSSAIYIYLNVQPASLILSASPNPGVLGQDVTLTATVSPSTATGLVTFFDQLGTIGTVPLNSGTAVLHTTSLPANQQVLSASYSGDPVTAYASSTYVFEKIAGLSSSLTLAAPASPILFGARETLIATVSPNTVSGVVSFFSASQVLGTATLENGLASFSTALLPAGQQTLRATYQGNATYNSEPSGNALTVQVNSIPATAYRPVFFPTANGILADAAADFNGDGKTDLLAQQYLGGYSSPFMILLGEGDGSFQLGVSIAAGGSPNDQGSPPFAIGDFNGDGRPDLALADSFSSSIVILLNQGDATFGPPSYYFGAVRALATADLNGDGIPDLVALSDAGFIQVLSGLGDGTFVTVPQTMPPGVNSIGNSQMAVGDFNHDGKTDVAVSGYTTNAVAVFLGNGNSSFQPPSTIAFAATPKRLAVADLNHDGNPDLIVQLDGTDYSLAVLLGSGNGAFAAPVSVSGLSGLVDLSVSDFNGDGKLDVAVNNATSFSLLYGNGDGTLQAPVSYPAVNPSVVAADYNGDGRVDFPGFDGALADSLSLISSAAATPIGQPLMLTATVSPAGASGTVTFYEGATILGTVPVVNGVATLSVPPSVSGLQQITARYHGDGNYTTAASSAVPVTVTTVAGGTFGNAVNYATGTIPAGVATGDFNHDGHLDLAVANSADNTVSVFWGSGDGTYGTSTVYPAGNNPVALVSADFNGDGVADLVVADAGSNSLSLLLSSGNTLVAGTAAPLTITPASLAAGDINGDGRADLIIGPAPGGYVSVALFGNGDGTFTLDTGAPGLSGGLVALGDLNADGNPDYVSPSQVALGSATGVFYDLSYNLQFGSIFTLADFNNDGKLDIAYIPYDLGAVQVSLGNGDGSFGLPSARSPFPSAATSLVTGYFNGDGFPDLALTNSSGVAGLMVGNGDGTFRPEVTFPTGTNPVAIAVGDFNGDGRLDLAVANKGSNTLSILLGAASSCTFTIAPSSFAFQQIGGTATVNVTASAPSCQWSASFSQTYDPYATLFTTSGTGNGSFSVPISANASGTLGTGTIQVANQKASVTVAITNQIFDDVPFSAYYFDAANLLYENQVSSGCSATDFCPNDLVTRAEMAIFIVRGIFHTDQFTYTTAPYFTDVPPTAFGFQWIQKLRDLNITTGCGPSLFCPNDSLTRAQAAVFLIRARYGATTQFPYAPTPFFSDVPSTNFAFQWVQRLKQDNITTGCSAMDFCPDNNIIRGDMAIFVMRALFNELLPVSQPVLTNSQLYGGTPLTVSLTGKNTHFDQTNTQVTVPGLVITSVAVNSPNALTAYGTRDSSVPAGPVSAIAVTGDEVAVGPNQIQLP